MTASWVVREISTGRVIAETFNKALVDVLNTERYEAIPIGEYLASLNLGHAIEVKQVWIDERPILNLTPPRQI